MSPAVTKQLKTVTVKAKQNMPDQLGKKARKRLVYRKEKLELLTQSLAFISRRCVKRRERVLLRA